MKCKKIYGIVAVLAMNLVLGTVSLAQVPKETSSAQLSRTVQSGNRLSGALSKNLFKKEAYQEKYQEQVPYEVTETYTEQVPYQTTETYTERIPYQDTESYTERVPYQRQESYIDQEEYYDTEYKCRTTYEQDCRHEQQCRNVTKPVCNVEYICNPRPSEPESCQNVEECGENALGERICKTRRVCSGGGGGGQDCRNERRCRDETQYECNSEYRCNNVPKERCGYENVTKTRSVTKYRTVTDYRTETRTREVTRYRSETRTREVTKYRSETRSREVTKYRTETKCCVTKYRDVFDQQKSVQVEILFPSAATLVDSEVESFSITLSAFATDPVVDFKVKNSIYGYSVLNQTVTGSTLTIELGLVAKYSEAQVGVSSISTLTLGGVAGARLVNFEDKGHFKRIESSYVLKLFDVAGSLVFESPKVAGGAAKVSIEIGATEINRALRAELSVERTGVVLANAVAFTKSQASLVTIAAGSFADRNLVGKFSLSGSGRNLSLAFRDSSPLNALVSSKYMLMIKSFDNGVEGDVIAQGTVTREQFSVPVGEKMIVKVASLTHNGEASLDQLLRSRKSVKVSLRALRDGPFAEGTLTIDKSVALTVE